MTLVELHCFPVAIYIACHLQFATHPAQASSLKLQLAGMEYGFFMHDLVYTGQCWYLRLGAAKGSDLSCFLVADCAGLSVGCHAIILFDLLGDRFSRRLRGACGPGSRVSSFTISRLLPVAACCDAFRGTTTRGAVFWFPA